MIDIIRQGKTFYDPLWNHAAMSPRNPISHVTYKGGNRMILMLEVMKNGYRDPRWMTYRQLSEKGYYVMKGEHGTRLEKWIFSKWMRAVDEHGIPKSDADGKPIYEEYLLQSPIYNTFVVFNGEQVQDFPVYQPVNPSPGQTEQKVNALIRSSACPVHEIAQARSFYRVTEDAIYLPLRSEFRSMEAFATVAAHEMIHSTGHDSRLGRTFGSRAPVTGEPDPNYCQEELRAEIGALFLMNDLGIPLQETDYTSSAAYTESYLRMLSDDPSSLFRAAADAEKAEQYLMRRYEMISPPVPMVDRIPEREKTVENPGQGKPEKKAGNRFNNFHQRTYDYEKLEQALMKRQLQETSAEPEEPEVTAVLSLGR